MKQSKESKDLSGFIDLITTKYKDILNDEFHTNILLFLLCSSYDVTSPHLWNEFLSIMRAKLPLSEHDTPDTVLESFSVSLNALAINCPQELLLSLGEEYFHVSFAHPAAQKERSHFNRKKLISVLTQTLRIIPDIDSNIKNELQRMLGDAKSLKEKEDFYKYEGHIGEMISYYSGLGFDELINKLIAIKDLISAPKTTLRLGDFSSSKNRITLYPEAIKEGYPSFDSYVAHTRSTYLHELFHAFHYASMKDKSQWANMSKILKESLASYFEYHSCTDAGIQNNLKDSWETNPKSWPYAGARIICQEMENDETFFSNIFHLTCEGKDEEALRLLHIDT